MTRVHLHMIHMYVCCYLMQERRQVCEVMEDLPGRHVKIWCPLCASSDDRKSHFFVGPYTWRTERGIDGHFWMNKDTEANQKNLHVLSKIRHKLYEHTLRAHMNKDGKVICVSIIHISFYQSLHFVT